MKFPGDIFPWTKIQSALKTYVSEASSFSDNPVCPECGTATPNDGWRVESDEGGDPAVWTYLCRCGTTMKVFND